MSFFYKYVDLSTYNQLQQEGEGDEVSSDETRALILSQDKEQEQKQGREKNEKGNESEFWLWIIQCVLLTYNLCFCLHIIFYRTCYGENSDNARQESYRAVLQCTPCRTTLHIVPKL